MIAILIIAATLIIDTITDLRLWDSGKINHSKGLILRLIPLTLAAILDWHTLFLWPLYGCLFNLGLNIGRGLPLDYIGETSRLDKLMRQHPWLQWAEWICGAGGLALYLILMP